MLLLNTACSQVVHSQNSPVTSTAAVRIQQTVKVIPFFLLLQGRFNRWIQDRVGLDPANLYPSVRSGLEGAVLTALADLQGLSLASLLNFAHSPGSHQVAASQQHVLVNGLLDCGGSVEECVSEAAQLVAQGYSAIKVKVCACNQPCHFLALQSVMLSICDNQSGVAHKPEHSVKPVRTAAPHS